MRKIACLKLTEEIHFSLEDVKSNEVLKKTQYIVLTCSFLHYPGSNDQLSRRQLLGTSAADIAPTWISRYLKALAL